MTDQAATEARLQLQEEAEQRRRPKLRFTAEQVCDHANITSRQLDHWTRAGYLADPRPPELQGSGYGRARGYTLGELIEVSNMGALIRAGFRVEAAARLASAHRRDHWETP